MSSDTTKSWRRVLASRYSSVWRRESACADLSLTFVRCVYAHLIIQMSLTNRRRIQSGLLDTLVERIARTTESSAVFVTAETPSTGLGLLAEFPRSSASATLGANSPDGPPRDTGMGGRVVAMPIRV